MVCKFRKSQRIEKKIVAVVYGDAHTMPSSLINRQNVLSSSYFFSVGSPPVSQNVWMSGNRFCKSVVTLVNSSTPAKFGSLANGARCEHAVQFLLQISVTEYSI